MACLEQGELMAYLDGELDPRRREKIAVHLQGCDHCRGELESLQQNRKVVHQALDEMQAAAVKAPVNLDQAWQRFAKGTTANGGEQRRVTTVKKTWLRPLVAGLLGVVVIGSLTLPPVRAAASSFLSVFRVEKMQVVNISPNDLQQLQKVLQEKGGSLNIKDFGEITVTSAHKENQSVTWEEASRLTGFKLAVPGTAVQSRVYFSSGMDVEVKPQVEPINQLLRSMGGKILLPKELNGQTFQVKMPPMVSASLTTKDNVALTYMQTVSPQISGPDNVNVEQIRQAVLAVPALPEDLRRQLSAIKDWQQVLPVPMAQDASRTVTIQGTSAILGRSLDNQLILVWQKDGVIRLLTGPAAEAQLMAVAEGLK